MRHILVDYARARNSKKRSDGRVRISLSDVEPAAGERDEDLVALDEALSRLEAIDPRASRDIAISTLKRDWTFAKAWLFDRLAPGPTSE
jgi:hypothetical protein